MPKISRLTSFIIVAGAIVVSTCVMFWLVRNSLSQQTDLFKKMLVQEATAHFNSMVVARSWNANHGGVYVLDDNLTDPNPYLEDNTLLAADGRTLIKINPAWMTRQLSELSNRTTHYYYKITSLKPINPTNKPDVFESEALHRFETHPDEPYYYRLKEDFSHFDFMGALKVDPSCLSCHAQQGYKVGEIRGGIRVSVPIESYRDNVKAIHKSADDINIMLLVYLFAALLIAFWIISLVFRHQDEIKALNQGLEEKVATRTNELKGMYQHEKYLKEMLKTVADVNEMLVTSLSAQMVIENSANRLVRHQHYNLICIEMLHDTMLEPVYIASSKILQPGGIPHCPDKEMRPWSTTAVTLNSPVIERLDDTVQKHFHALGASQPVHWVLSMPLRSSENDSPLGALTIYSDWKDGFDPEEVKIVENLATDIGMTLHAHQQRTLLKEMELEKISNYEETILAFVDIIEQRDSYTAGHTLRVAEYSKRIAETMGISSEHILKLEKAAILHDIGKVATPDSILLKPGHLSPLEYELIKLHAEAGYSMLSKIDMYRELAEIIRYHHVRYDGKGYPATPDPDAVPLTSYVMALADAFDAMTTNRIYKPRKQRDEALEEIRALSGSQFHPAVVDAAHACLSQIELREVSSQLPSSELEQRRFAYFFQDALTDTFNEAYLQIVLSNKERPYRWLQLINLRNFTNYNKTFGWNAGDSFLKTFAADLRKQYPHAMIFRFHGDDFVLLLKELPSDTPDTFEFDIRSQDQDIYVQTRGFELEAAMYNATDLMEKIQNGTI